MEVMGKCRLDKEEAEEHGIDTNVKDCNKRRHEVSILNDELIFYEILPWVPIKPLIRLKLICNSWCTRISTDSVFKTSQFRRSVSNPPHGLIYKGHSKYVFLHTTTATDLVGLPDLNKYNTMCDRRHLKYVHHICDSSMLSSSNGLLCGSYYRDGTEYFYVSNPLTNEMVSIPTSNKLEDVALAFEPLTCNPYFTLVARTRRLYPNKTTDIGFLLYSSKKGIWEVSNAKVRILRWIGSFLRFLNRSVFTGGKLHWKLGEYVLWYHVEEDNAGVMTIPGEKERYRYAEIGDLNGELSYTNISTQGDIGVWVLKSNKTTEFKWVNIYCLSLKSLFEYTMKSELACKHTLVMKLAEASTYDLFRRPIPYEGGDVLMFWLNSKLEEKGKEGIVVSYNIKTGCLWFDHQSELRRWEGPLLSYTSCLVSLPQLCNPISCESNSNAIVGRSFALLHKLPCLTTSTL